MNTSPRRTFGAVAVAVAALILAGCGSTPTGSGTASPTTASSSQAGTPTPSLSASPSQSSTVEVTVTPVLRAEMTRHGLDPADLMDGDCLKVTGQNVKQVLRLLNEDLFQGGFSHQPYAASTKRAL